MGDDSDTCATASRRGTSASSVKDKMSLSLLVTPPGGVVAKVRGFGRGWYGKLKTHVRDVAFRTRDFRSCGTPCSPARRCVARAPLHSCSHALALLYSAGGCLPGLASNSRVGAWQLHRLSLSGGRSTQHVEARCTARDSTSVWLRHAQPCGVLVAHSPARPHPIQLPPTRSPWKPSDRRFSLRGKQS